MLKTHQRHSRESGNPAERVCATKTHTSDIARNWIPAFAGMTLVGLFFLTTPVLADQICYSPVQLEAEHMLRLHSELMVITITCKVGSQGEDLVGAYTGFTKRHIKELHEAENTMSAYYSSHGGHGEDRLDKLRTLLGNEFGQKIADMSAQPFCDAYRDKVLKFASVSNADVLNEVQRMEVADRSYVEPCNVGTTTVAKSSH